ncbi:phosphodiester glycosidase family protein [Alicyclobacillus suci]|uniref:phosphodiester glycosidase family protein n=1 Tax=Alicyclobacillus suci TaxID=2816080 RepID=UPI001A8D63B1|nr:phosphodiester glycosidase family protein [Alicyclobacillus suci]
MARLSAFTKKPAKPNAQSIDWFPSVLLSIIVSLLSLVYYGAIGQTSDGQLIFVVTDGREANGKTNIGPSLLDMKNLMLKYGAVTAATLSTRSNVSVK